jgi:hypothetical protein
MKREREPNCVSGLSEGTIGMEGAVGKKENERQ